MSTAPAEYTKSMTEDELLTAITEAATFLGWRWHHVRRSDKAVQMGHVGFPDLVLVRKGDVLFWELKAEAGTMTGAQGAWIEEINHAEPHGGICQSEHRARFVRPSDLDWALERLK